MDIGTKISRMCAKNSGVNVSANGLSRPRPAARNQEGEPPCRASPSGRPGRTRGATKWGFVSGYKAGLRHRHDSHPSQESRSTPKAVTTAVRYNLVGTPAVEARSVEWTQVRTGPDPDAPEPCREQQRHILPGLWCLVIGASERPSSSNACSR